MSRRDTIIIAVLVNAGLLLVLFATAMRSNKEVPPQALNLAEAPPLLNEAPILLPPLESIDENVDQVLNHYASAPTLGHSEEILFPATPSPSSGIESLLPAEQNIAAYPAARATASPLTSPSPTFVSPSPSSENRYATVTVKKGDMLEKIARANGSNVAAIMKANNLSSTQLKVGQVLRVPTKEGSSSSATASSPKKEASSTGSDYYVVKEGDSPWLIASKNHVKLEELLKLNNLDEQKARRLKPGDRLRIR